MNGAAQARSSSLLSAVPASAGGRSAGNYLETKATGSPYASPPGFVHTSYTIFDGATDGSHNCTRHGKCPPADVFEAHPSWFWPQNDSSLYGQLCWHNQSLIDFVVVQAKRFLSTQPDARIVSISQNDNGRYCHDPAELKIIQEEGSPSGPLLRAVNQVAKALATEFPLVAVDTLAYQWSQQPPTKTVPEHNVIIRLCDINSNAGMPLTHHSNTPFRNVLTSWSGITDRIYIWNCACMS